MPQTHVQPLQLSHDQLRAEFGRMLMTIRRILSESPKKENNLEACKELCIYLKASDSVHALLFSAEKRVEVNNCSNFKQLFEILNQHLSWDELSILTQIIDECGSDEAEQEFKKYKRKMAVSKALEIISSIESNPPPGFEKFCVIIDKSYKKLTIEEYEEIKKFVFENLDTHRYVTNEYIRVLFASLHLEWHVTILATPHMIKMIYERKEFFKKSHFVFMQVGEKVIVNVYAKQTVNLLKLCYKATWFTSTYKEFDWPPEQSKHFTPVMMIHQDEKQSKKERKAMTAATNKGGTEEWLLMATNKITKDLKEVFSLLEQPSDSQHQRSILVEGSPGVGKTVLLKHAAYLWAEGELLRNYDFLFLLYLRDPSVQQIDSLHALVCHFYQDYDEQQASQVKACVAEDNGKSVAILLDGYDELPPKLRQNSFIVDLLQHKILPYCSIVVSSHSHNAAHLRANTSCQVEILGFSVEDQQDFIKYSLNDDQDKISELNEYLKQHSTISDLCFIPFNIVMLLFLYKEKKYLPTSLTGLYSLFICLAISRYLAKTGISITICNEIKDLNSLPQPYRKTINHLSKFAFKALGNNQLVFTLADIEKMCPDISKYINGFGLLQAVEYIGTTSKQVSFNFIHLSMQEYLAAHYFATLPPSKKKLSILRENFWDNPAYFNMFDIYVALTNGQQSSFKQFLQPSLMERIKTFFTGREVEGPVGISQQLISDKVKCLRIYHCFQGAGDTVMCQSIENAAGMDKEQIDLKCTRLSPNDLESLIVFLTCSSCKKWERLNMWCCFIQDHGLEILQRGLRNSNVTIKRLLLHDNDLSAVSSSAISDLTISCRAQELTVSGNKTVGEDDGLYRVITDQSSMVEELYMWSTKLSSVAAIKLFNALGEARKLKILEINSNDVTDEACDSIVVAMKKNTSLIKLSLCRNPISIECAYIIIEALQHNHTLQRLTLNRNYSHDGKEKIKTLQKDVNMKRQTCGCYVTLEIDYFIWL